MRKFVIFFAALILNITVSYGQDQAKVSGKVIDPEGNPIVAAVVMLDGTAFKTETDAEGKFVFTNVPKGQYLLSVITSFYQPCARQIDVNGPIDEITVTMEPTTNSLSEVELFGERNRQPEKLETITRMPLKPSEQIQSISVISDKVIEKQGNLTISEATRNVPGVYTFATYGNKRESMSSRGYRGIPILKNGVRINSDFRGTGVLADMQGVESMQVLKGAAAITQGVATDIGSPGGIINIVTKTPRYYSGGEASLRIGSFGQVRPTFDLFGPLNESKTIAYRINGAYERADSYRRGISYQKLYINPSLQWKPDEKSTLTLEMDYLDDGRTPDLGTVNLATNDINAIYDLPYNQFLGFKSDRSITRNATFGARFNRMLNKKLSIRAAFYHSNLNIDDTGAGLSSGGRDGLPEVPALNLRYRTISNSTRLDKNSVLQFDLIGQEVKTAFLKHTFMVGMDYRRMNVETGSRSLGSRHFVDIIDIYSPINNSLPETVFQYIPANQNTGTPADTIEKDLVLTAGNTTNSQTTAYGLMAQDVISLTDWAKVWLGIRYSTSQSHGSNSIGTISGSAINPQFGLMFSIIKGLNVFGSYTSSTSLASASEVDINGNPLDDERIDQIEAGIKSDWFKNRLRFNLTLYKINNRNMNIPVYLNLTSTSPAYYEKGGNDERKGIETELIGQLTKNLEIITGYAYIDAQYKEHSSYYPGSAPLNTPKHTANAWLNYSFSKGFVKGASIGLGAYYVGERPVNDYSSRVTHEGIVPGQAPFYIKPYTTVNAQIGYQFKEHFNVRLLFNNIFNTIGYNAYRTSWINQTDPRNFAAVVSYRF